MKGWIAVDFDGTLATYVGNHTIMGNPILPMVKRVRGWLEKGHDVRIFTARVSFKDEGKNEEITKAIQEWCLRYVGKALPVTCVKDYACVQIWDDKAIRVIKNTGYSEDEYRRLKKRV